MALNLEVEDIGVERDPCKTSFPPRETLHNRHSGEGPALVDTGAGIQGWGSPAMKSTHARHVSPHE